jgi:hypothetical protein
MSENITQLSDSELDAVGAGLYIKAYVDLSTNIKYSHIDQDNYSKVYAKWGNEVTVAQPNSVGTTVNVNLGG